jgi:adenylate cyclase class IV
MLVEIGEYLGAFVEIEKNTKEDDARKTIKDILKILEVAIKNTESTRYSKIITKIMKQKEHLIN